MHLTRSIQVSVFQFCCTNTSVCATKDHCSHEHTRHPHPHVSAKEEAMLQEQFNWVKLSAVGTCLCLVSAIQPAQWASLVSDVKTLKPPRFVLFLLFKKGAGRKETVQVEFRVVRAGDEIRTCIHTQSQQSAPCSSPYTGGLLIKSHVETHCPKLLSNTITGNVVHHQNRSSNPHEFSFYGCLYPYE